MCHSGTTQKAMQEGNKVFVFFSQNGKRTVLTDKITNNPLGFANRNSAMRYLNREGFEHPIASGFSIEPATSAKDLFQASYEALEDVNFEDYFSNCTARFVKKLNDDEEIVLLLPFEAVHFAEAALTEISKLVKFATVPLKAVRKSEYYEVTPSCFFKEKKSVTSSFSVDIQFELLEEDGKQMMLVSAYNRENEFYIDFPIRKVEIVPDEKDYIEEAKKLKVK
jgi:hypothetical protein